MDNKKVFFGVLTLVAVYLCVVLSVAVFKPQNPSTLNLQGNSVARTISVNASSSIKMKPDTAVLNLGVETTGSTVKAASDSNSVIADKVISALKKAGVSEDDIQTSNFNVSQNYDNLTQKYSGYIVTNSITVRCPVEKASTVLQTAVDSGANQFSNLTYEIDKEKREAAQTTLLNESLKEAETKARKIVDGTNVKVGNPISINPSYGYTPYVYRNDSLLKDASAASSQIPTEAGLTEVTASIDVVYELIP